MNSEDFRKAVTDAVEYLAFYKKDVVTFQNPIEVEWGYGEDKIKVIPTICFQKVDEE